MVYSMASSSDDKAGKSPLPTKDKVPMRASQMPTAGQVSPVPGPKAILRASSYGQLLTPVPGRLTPTGQGRVKAPPVCRDTVLKQGASTIAEIETYSEMEAASCARKALMIGKEGGGENCGEELPLNVEQCDPEFSWKAPSEPTAFTSSSSTVITNSSASSCGGSAIGNSHVAPSAARKDPPLEVVSADLAAVSGDEHPAKTESKAPQLTVVTASQSTPAALPSSFTDNLIKDNSSRQGRSLQRWLIHSPTEELVRQVAGTVPITRDGRIVLVSASRKTEWILPKGGWDTDETKEECATRETFEEGGLLGRLGGCLEPIDYETNKARKRRLSQLENGGGESGGSVGNDKESKEAKGDGRISPPLPKRLKTGLPAFPSLTSSTKSPGLSESASDGKNKEKYPKNYSFVRLFLFPLYVTSAKSDWPEKGRLRKLVDIDEAIKIMEAENRPYFKRGLEMVKERGLHLLKPEGGPY
ncbi:hypothetical protein ACHAWF_011151 [Thalassiosira exigua]